MQTVDKVMVFYHGKNVGTIAPYGRYQTAFAYSEEWLQSGFSVSPFSLPLEPGVKIAKADPFEGLFGTFADSLPDGWGRLLVDRMLRSAGEKPEEITAMTRLSIVGQSGLGALEYKPVYQTNHSSHVSDFDQIADECRKILASKESGELDTLFALGGSSGGARPKIMIRSDQEDWIIKFPSSADPDNIGLQEYEYALCAQKCGIDIPEVRLFSSQKSPGYFGSRRFDRSTKNGSIGKIHMVSASALLEISHRIPSIDYTSLMALTWQLTKDSDELMKLFRLMCFNVFAHNRDDHSNNFSFLYQDGKWRLAPAYDLTYFYSLGGEHATTIAGEGRNPGLKDLLQVAKTAGIPQSIARKAACQIQDIVKDQLSAYLK